MLELFYRINKHSLMLPSHARDTEEIVHKNMRMGIGVTGYLQATDEQKSWLDDGYKFVRTLDEEYSEKMGWPISIKLTTVKPSGTLSLLPGVTPGAHPGYARYMYRRIRMSAEHMLVDVCKAHGYPVEYQINLDKSKDFGTVVVTFPFSYPEGTTLAADMTAIDQLKVMKELQQNWSDNSVSNTIYYKKEELPKIREYLAENYAKCHKTVSFLLHSDHGFIQAPYEEITKEVYDELVSKTTVITSVSNAGDFEDDGTDCAGGACPVR